MGFGETLMKIGGFLILWTPFVDLKLDLYISLENMSKSDPKLQVLALFFANRPLLALEILPHRLTGPVDRSPFHRSTSPVELHSSVTGRPVPTETDPK
ncbi:hypothetical protein L484_024898 [Morus notabilis]|uniref:Uncharacterized protein n=1 Tax=Morus notabilis TaxID=981085 RepID=W9R3G1_9ROSA|nr:hypothetical protein L484_024898 [Morus notabilis]